MRSAFVLAGAAIWAASPCLAQFFHEKPGDPYLPPPMIQQTTPAMVVRGPGPQSVQVNVNAAGMNLVGDAANEPSIAVDPFNRNNITIVWRQFDNIASSFRQAGHAWSSDGGATWNNVGPVEPGVSRSDPVIRTDADGVFYFISLRADFFTCQLFVSTDRGRTFPTRFDALGGDKEWITIDTTAGPGRGNIYQHWSSRFSRSLNGGAAWSPQVPGNPVWGMSAVGPDGTLHIVGMSSPSPGSSVMATRSASAQHAAQTPAFTALANVGLGGLRGFVSPSPNPGGLLGQAQVAVDCSHGPRRGWVYALCSTGPHGTDPLEVRFTRSTDGGATWSPAVRVNSSMPGPNDWQWFGTMGVAPNGRIDVIFNDTRESQSVSASRLYYAWSQDGGDTWHGDTPVGPTFNSHTGWPNQTKLGDYNDIASDRDGASIAYAATYTGGQDVYYMRIDNRNCQADFDGNGALTIGDIFRFLEAWFLDGPHTDFDASGARTIADIFAMLAAWFIGC